MTTIIYRDGVLTGDRRYGVPSVAGELVFINRPKIHMHSTGKLAFGICGFSKGKDAHIAIGDFLLTCLIAMDKGKEYDFSPMFGSKVAETSTVIVMSKKVAIAIWKDEDEVKTQDLDELPYFIVGSGQWPAVALINEGCPIDRLYKIVSGIDGMTGGIYDEITRKTIKALGARNVNSSKKR